MNSTIKKNIEKKKLKRYKMHYKSKKLNGFHFWNTRGSHKNNFIKNNGINYTVLNEALYNTIVFSYLGNKKTYVFHNKFSNFQVINVINTKEKINVSKLKDYNNKKWF